MKSTSNQENTMSLAPSKRRNISAIEPGTQRDITSNLLPIAKYLRGVLSIRLEIQYNKCAQLQTTNETAQVNSQCIDPIQASMINNWKVETISCVFFVFIVMLCGSVY